MFERHWWRVLGLQGVCERPMMFPMVPTHFAVQSSIGVSVYEVPLKAPWRPFPAMCANTDRQPTRSRLNSFYYIAKIDTKQFHASVTHICNLIT